MRWLAQRVHSSWHIAWMSTGFLVGVGLAVSAPAWFADAMWPVIAAALAALGLLRGARGLVLASLVAGLLLGLARGTAGQQALQAYAPYYKQVVLLQGRLGEDASYGPQGDQRLRLQAVQVNHRPLPGEVWISTTSDRVVKRGDNVAVQGSLGPGFGNVPATMFRAQLRSITHPQPGDVARAFRDWFATGIRRAIPEPQASLGVGYLVGQRSALPAGFDDQLRTVGLTHAVVASGYNLTILVGFARRLFSGISKYMATLAGSMMIAGFMLITGLSPSMSRAGLVSGLSLAAWYYGRAIHPLVLLPFSAAVTAWLRPAYVWGDIGWYLSFTAFAGVIVLAPLLQRYFWGERKPGVFRQILVDTVAAQLATMPIILLAFGQYSAYALPANLLVLPLVPLAMVCTFAAGIAGLALPGLSHWAGLPATLILTYSTKVIGWIAAWPGAQSEVHISVAWLAGMYLLLVLIAVHMWRRTGLDFRA